MFWLSNLYKMYFLWDVLSVKIYCYDYYYRQQPHQSGSAACAMIPNQQNFTRHDERFNNFSTIFSGCQIGQVHVTFKSDQAQWHSFSASINSSSWSIFLTESYILNISPSFHRTFGNLFFCKIYEDSKLKSPSSTRGSLTLATNFNLSLTFMTQILIGSCVVRCAFSLAS